jgi:membrane protein DedA with SNARE-associated domain
MDLMFEAATLIEHFPYIGIFLLSVLGDIGFPFPEDATFMLSGFLIAQNRNSKTKLCSGLSPKIKSFCL